MNRQTVQFGRVWGASGVQGFFGEGYAFHEWFRKIGLAPDFHGMTFVAKTTTLRPNQGNMPLRSDHRPKKLFPDCIEVHWASCHALNAVGLSGPGAATLFNERQWNSRFSPFFLSFMPIGTKQEERLEETEEFVRLLRCYLPLCPAPVGLQINFSCPNTGHDLKGLMQEASDILDIAGRLNIPLAPKLNALVNVEAARDLSQHPCCDMLVVSNTIPWGQLPDRIPWKEIFGDQSPLEKRGYSPGGYSGQCLLPITIDWIRRARKAGITKHINGGGGILSLRDATKVLNAGADSISLGSIAFFRPWRVQGIIRALR